ncbi:coiled-coil domain-containing protein 186-like [Culex quinquefasciatus]|uniref:coiled-coil domain-containing protein 186-like n=1 Tax=Culex quinquefasciatus TaxID=7176 RepID=UPI0018E349EA|nr:coiled-coil domain-containing protein 186-like [Culex quinquefasciatus]
MQSLERELQEIKTTNTCHTNENYQEKIDELKANQITLKHINSEQVDKICCLEKQLEDACNEIASVKAQLAVFQEKVTCIESENKKLKETIFELQILLDDHMLKVADLQSKSSELEACRAAFSIEQSTNKEYAFTIERLNKLADGHSKDIEILRQNESELLALNEKLSFSNVILQNEISLYQSKSLAIAIENDSVKKSQVEYEGNVQRLVDKINLDRKNLAEERLTVATHVTEKNRECEMLKKQLEQALGDLDAVRKKNSLIVKDLQREISTLKKKFKTEADSSEIERSPSKDNLEPIYDSQTEQEKQCFEAFAKPLTHNSPHWKFMEKMKRRLKSLRFVHRDCASLAKVCCK